MRSWILIGTLAVGALTALWAGGQNTTGQNDEAGLRKAVDAYGAALQAGDIEAIKAFWSPDADYVDEEGKKIKGRDAILNLYRDNIAEIKASKVVVKIKNLRFLTPDVAVMDGVVETTAKDGDTDVDNFSTVWTRSSGKWVMSSARNLPETSEEMAERGLTEIKWLIGDWVAESGALKINLKIRSALGNKFLHMEFAIQSANQKFDVVQFLGWDPTQGAVRTWTFDSRGGFGEGVWERTASVWQGETEAVMPTGQISTAVTFLRMAGPDSFVWQATEREVDGQPIPDNEVKYTRVKSSK